MKATNDMEKLDPIGERLAQAEDVFSTIIEEKPSREEALGMIRMLKDTYASVSTLCSASALLSKIDEKLTMLDLLLSEDGYQGNLVLLKVFLLLEQMRLMDEINKAPTQ